MAKVKILAVEDDELYADTLRMVMDQLSYDLIDVVSEPSEVIRLLNATDPDVLLMDIDLGAEINGIDLVKKINEVKDVPVIYVTSYKDKEVIGKAMATIPEGYVTKPYEACQLQAAIELAISRNHQVPGISKGKKQETEVDKYLFIKENNTLIKMAIDAILLVEAYDKYCFIYTSEKKHLISSRLKDILDTLPDEKFLQIHRSYIVNLQAIDKIKLNNNCIEVAGKDIPISKTHKANLFSRLKTI